MESDALYVNASIRLQNIYGASLREGKNCGCLHSGEDVV